jgi:hypothetical protein
MPATARGRSPNQITCGGPFDTATRHYLDNIVVYSRLVC